MTHPIAEVAAGIAVVVAIGAGAALVIPVPSKPEPAEMSEAERVERLTAELRLISAEHRRLADDIAALRRERRDREGR
jgi:hypothetical protein